MKYKTTFPEEPNGPLWDENGSKCVKESPNLWVRIDAITGEKTYRSWEGLLLSVEHLTDNYEAMTELESAKKGAYYWVKGWDDDAGRSVNGVGYVSDFDVVCSTDPEESFRELCISIEEDSDDKLDELVPIVAVPADLLVKLANTKGDEVTQYQAEICDWLQAHPQVNWKEQTK